jgi:hypothetical protein
MMRVWGRFGCFDIFAAKKRRMERRCIVGTSLWRRNVGFPTCKRRRDVGTERDEIKEENFIKTFFRDCHDIK